MKRKLLALVLVLVMLVGCMGVLSACGGEEDPPPHEHKFDQKVTQDKYKKSAATETSPAVYFYSCSCGEKGTTTFNHGTALGGGEEGGGEGGGPVDPPIVEYPWGNEEQNVLFQVNPNTNSGNLSSGTERYLDGSDKWDTNNEWVARIDELIDTRNEQAKANTHVNVTWSYLNATQYGWGAGIQYLFDTTSDDDAPDFYIFFIYDLVSASLKCAFANLFSQSRGENYFEFAEYGDEYEEDGTGYMYAYMRSLTLSKYKMYVLASDYFTDLIRSFFVVPVNADLIASIPVDEASLDNWENGPWVYNSDRTGDGQFNMKDMYKLVYDMDWDYSALIAFSAAISSNSNTSISGWDIGDKLGFAMDRGSGLPASGLVYTTTVTVINRTWDDNRWYDSTQHDEVLPEHGDYVYSYPETNSDLVDLCTRIATLMSSKGIAVVNKKDQSDKQLVSSLADNGTSGMQAIRTRFVNDMILFGGIVNVGAIEDVDTYQSMTIGTEIGFGVVPVPLYKSYEEYEAAKALNPEAPDCKYQTQIHNNARAGAIGVRCTANFSALTAYLNYQSLNSTEILEEYYTVQLMLEATGGDQDTGDMLAFIRTNVRSSFDKAFEDAIGRAFSEATNKDDPDSVSSEDMKWHALIKESDFSIGEGVSALYESYREAKEEHLKTLYAGYGALDEVGGLPD